MSQKIFLSKNPLDDYQRTIFSDRQNKYTSILPQWTPDITQISYKSNLIYKINEIPILGPLIFDPLHNNNSKSNSDGEREEWKVGRDILHCSEYALPKIAVKAFEREVKKSNIECLLNKNLDHSTNIPTRFENDVQHTRSTSSNHKTDEETHPLDEKILNNFYKVKEDPRTIGNFGDRDSSGMKSNLTTTIDGIEREERKEIHHGSLHTPGCTVIWSENIDFVFMTGIWKIYQDVMEELATKNREDLEAEENQKLKQFCLEEWDIISTNIFGRRSVFRKNLKSPFNHNLSVPKHTVSKGLQYSSNNNSNIKPFDFKWERIDFHIREQLLGYYRRYLIQIKKVEPTILNSMDTFKFAQKVRGGYTHIQGTWLPKELARRLCIMFAYPIRYLLVPLFGSIFPKECEDWYGFYEINRRKMRAFILPFDGNIINGSDNSKPSEDVNKIHETPTPSKVKHLNSDEFLRHPQKDVIDISELSPIFSQHVVTSRFSDKCDAPLHPRPHSNDDTYFQPRKKPSKIEKRFQQNSKVQEKISIIQSSLRAQSEPPLSLADGQNIQLPSNHLNPVIYNPTADHYRHVRSLSEQESMVIPSFNFQQRPLNQVNLPNGPVPINSSSNGTINSFPSENPNVNNVSMLVDNQRGVYNQIPLQGVVYSTPFVATDSRVGNAGTLFILPIQPTIVHNVNNYPPNLPSQYITPGNSWVTPTRQSNQIVHQSRQLPIQTRLSPCPPVIQPNIIQNYPTHPPSSSNSMNTTSSVTNGDESMNRRTDVTNTAMFPNSKLNNPPGIQGHPKSN